MDLPVAERTDKTGMNWTVRRVPLGAVAAIAPWNFPLMLACWARARADGGQHRHRQTVAFHAA